MPIFTTYIGTKIIQATPMNGAQGQPGYQVVYEDGYTSWSPKDVFERAYRKTDAMTFGDAILMLKDGKKVARAGWNGKGMWLALSLGHAALEASKFWAEPNRRHAEQMGGFATVLPCITMKTAGGEILMGWLASQTDMLAEDWQVVE